MRAKPESGLVRELLKWWSQNQRIFPWRNASNPYHLLVAEVLLHRTRANQVSRTYQILVERYPTLEALASADSEELFDLLKPLGLTWRAVLLRRMAEIVVRDYEGLVPDTVEELKSLPGLGDYIASAVACFAFGHPEPILDTNTVRIISRMTGMPKTESSRRSKKFKEAYQSIMSSGNVREFNLAMLDLGALVCLPKEPLCNSCPIARYCSFGSSRMRSSTSDFSKDSNRRIISQPAVVTRHGS